MDAAREAARRAGVLVQHVRGHAQAAEASQLLAEVWPSALGSPVAPELMLALHAEDNYVAVALVEDAVVGVTVAFRTGGGHPHLHSHITGVAAEHRGRSIGLALKLHQRSWALDRGIDLVSWTFDPLQARNAYFNLAKLGAAFGTYLPDFYGEMDDAINRGVPSDRALIEWRVAEQPAPDPPAPVHSHQLLVRDDTGSPSLRPLDTAYPLIVDAPHDIDTLRREAPELAATWQEALRAAFTSAFAAGYRATGFTRSSSYILTKETPDAD